MYKNKNKGFTLIELLVVIAIIAILSTFAVIALGNARAKARDAKRQADLKTLQTAIEMYMSDNDSIPNPGTPDSTNDRWDGATNNLESLLSEYLPGGLPEDPGSRDWVYCYNANNKKYLIAVALERSTDITGDLDSVSNWAATSECISSDDGFALSSNQLNCADSGSGTVSDDSGSALCLGSDDSD